MSKHKAPLYIALFWFVLTYNSRGAPFVVPTPTAEPTSTPTAASSLPFPLATQVPEVKVTETILPLPPNQSPVVQFIGQDLVDVFRITTDEIWEVGEGRIANVILQESDALIMARVAMGEAPDSFDDRVFIMWNIRLRAFLGYKNGKYRGTNAPTDTWGETTSIREEALCIGGCQYEPVRLLEGIFFPETVRYDNIRGMVSPNDAQLLDFWATYRAADDIINSPLTAFPIILRGYDSFRGPQVAWFGTTYYEGGLKNDRFFDTGNFWRDELSEDNEFWRLIGGGLPTTNSLDQEVLRYE